MKRNQKLCALVTAETVDVLVCPIFEGSFTSPLVKYFVPVIQEIHEEGRKTYTNLRTGEPLSMTPGQKVWSISSGTVLRYCHWVVSKDGLHRVQQKAVDAIFLVARREGNVVVSEQPLDWEPDEGLQVLDILPPPVIRKIDKGQTVVTLSKMPDLWSPKECQLRAAIAVGNSYRDLRTGEDITREDEESVFVAQSHTVYEWPDGYRIIWRDAKRELEMNYCGTFDPRVQKLVRING